MALIGVTLGMGSALGLTRLMANQLFGVSAHAPLTFAGVAMLLITVAIAACYMRAYRATCVDPMQDGHGWHCCRGRGTGRGADCRDRCCGRCSGWLWGGDRCRRVASLASHNCP